MRPAIILVLAIIVMGDISCRQKNSSTKGNNSLNYDTTVIAILNYDTAHYWTPQNSSIASLTQSDIDLIDSLLNTCVVTYNKEQSDNMEKLPKEYQQPEFVLIDSLKKYKRQYLPYIDSNGQKTVWINCFCTGSVYWKTQVFSVKDGGKCFFNLKVNLTTKTCLDLYVNGYG